MRCLFPCSFSIGSVLVVVISGLMLSGGCGQSPTRIVEENEKFKFDEIAAEAAQEAELSEAAEEE